MNRYRYVYHYIKGLLSDATIIYVLYNEKNNKFYKISYEDLYNYFEDQGYDDIEIKALDELELSPYDVKEIRSPLANAYFYMIYKLLQLKNNPKLLKKVVVVALTSILTIQGTKLANKYLFPQIVELIEEKKENDKAEFSRFDETIASNPTLNKELLEKIKKDLNYLVTRTTIYEKTANSIEKRLKEYDFSNITEENYDTCLAYILFGNESNISKVIADSLSSCNNLESSENNNLFGLISLEMSEDDLVKLMNKGPRYLETILMDSLKITKEEAHELTTNLNEYLETNDSKIKEKIMNKLSVYLTRKYQNEENITSFKEIILSSQLFNGSFYINYNIFSEDITINVSDSQYGNYNLYYNLKTREDISLDVYKEKLLKLVEEKGDNLDYDDPDCRFLYYLYYLCFTDGYHRDYQDILNTKTPQEVTDMMINKVFSADGFVTLNKEFLYSYFTNGQAHVYDLVYEISFIEEYSFDVALFREYSICLKKELVSNNITQEQYDELLSRIEDWIDRKLAIENEELYNEYLESLNEDDHIFEHFSLFGDYEYQNENLKQYEYKYN